MKKKSKLFSVFVVLALTFVFLVPHFQVFANTNYSIVRVRISFNNPPSSIQVVVNGEYLISEDPTLDIKRGAYTLSRTQDNKVRIVGMGIDKVVGNSVTFIRHQLEGTGTNHLTINGTIYGNINYLGDMRFTVDSGSLLVVNHVPIEQYLYGVVAYEMGNQFPLEALKAQAVSARGYAIRMIRTTGTHDLGDTAQHQVYRGYTPTYNRVIQAVNETKGQVLTYSGKIAETFYSASNGGQTEVPGNTWGGGTAKNAEYPYLVQKDDPFDLENSASIYHKYFVPQIVEGSSLDHVSVPGDYAVIVAKTGGNVNIRSGASTNFPVVGQAQPGKAYQWISTSGDWHRIRFNNQDAFISASFSQRVDNGRYLYGNPVLVDLQNQAFQALKSENPDISSANEVKIITVNNLENGNAQWPGTGSRAYVTANSNISVQYHVGDEELSEKRDLDISINLMNINSTGTSYLISHPYLSSNTRMRGISEAENGFYLNAGRFGHGVGMSQRGAEQMAAGHAKSFQEILAFYFEGTSLTTVNTDIPTLPVKPKPEEPTPPQEPTEPEDPTEPTDPVEPEEPVYPRFSSSIYKVNSTTIAGLTTNLKVSTFLSNISVEDGTVELVTPQGNKKNSGDTIGTGDVLKIKHLESNEVFEQYTVIIYGDVTGNGQISLVDLLNIRRHLLDISKLSGPYLTAADVTKDGNINLVDLLMFRRHLLDIEKIKQ